MRMTKVMAILFIGALLVSVACAPATATPSAPTVARTPATATPGPEPVMPPPTATAPAPAPVAPIIQTTPTPPLTVTPAAPITQNTPATPPPAPPATPKPAAFATNSLSIAPGTVRLGQTVTVNVTVTNTGEQSGTYPVVLKVDGFMVKTQEVTLAGGASQKVTLIFSMNLAGTYEVTIDQLAGKLVVQAAKPEMPGMAECAAM